MGHAAEAGEQKQMYLSLIDTRFSIHWIKEMSYSIDEELEQTVYSVGCFCQLSGYVLAQVDVEQQL